MRSKPEPFRRWIRPPSWSAAISGRMPLTVAAVVAAAIAVRVWERLPPVSSRRMPPGFCFWTMGRWTEVMPFALMPVMISCAACSLSVRVFSFWSMQLAGVGVGVVVGVAEGLGGSVVGDSLVGSGTDDDGTVLGPAVGGDLVSL